MRPEAVSGGGDQVALRVNDPPTGERDLLVDIAGRAQEVADLVKGSAEAVGPSKFLKLRIGR
jgi:hypothetical protein